MRTIGHFINGVETSGNSAEFQDVFNPATGEVQARVALATAADLDAAVAAAAAAQPAWAATNPQRRARVFFNFVALINRDMQALAELLSAEHGKTVEDAKGDILRGLEVAEFAAGAPHLLKGEFTDGAGPGIDMYSMRQPVGIGAGITPFNFPAMIPLWMLSPAIAAGNAFILKPSERDPSVPVRLAELAIEAGLPRGILNVVQGGKAVVDGILQHDQIGAVSFVGSTPIARYVYAKAAAEGIIAALKPRLEALKVGPASDPASEMGPVITKASQDRIAALVESGIAQGATLAVDGRGFTLQGYENGYFVGPSLFDHVTPDMDIYKEEIFGPVLSVVRAGTYEQALTLTMNNPYGNGTAIFTRDGDAARDFAARVNVGMVGINVPVPVPLAYHSFGGWKASAFGDLNQHGTDAIRFWTRTKTVTARWPSGIKDGAEFQMPTMK